MSENETRENTMDFSRMIVTIENDKGRKTSEEIRYIPNDEIPARSETVRQNQPRGTVYTIKVLAEN